MTDLKTTIMPRVDGDRLWRSLMELAAIGATPAGGVRRLALTIEDAAGRAWLMAEAESLGLAVRIDPVGNIFARRDGIEPSLLPVLIGSHIDTQPTGGKFDGTFGVLAGLEVVRCLNELGVQTRRSLEIVAWTNEEGSRFLPVMAGSGVFAGVHRIDDVFASRDVDGVAFGDAMNAIGAAGDAPLGFALDAYFEAHIEQGPILEDERATIGVVTGALGQRWFDCTLTGFEAHAGPTPMQIRRDALQGAATIIQAIDAIGRQSPDARSTVGMIECWPNSRNTIPGRVRFSVDLRHPDDAGLADMETALRTLVAKTAEERGLMWQLVPTNAWPACPFDGECIDLVRSSARALGFIHRDIVSGAGHDAVNIAGVAPTAMIFVPCRDGVSHNEIEDAAPSDLAAGADVLLGAVLARLNR